MKKYTTILIGSFLLFLFSQLIYSQAQTGVLRGYVTDAQTGEVLAYCNALIQGIDRGASSDSRGYFIIASVPANQDYIVRISYVGYKSKDINFTILPNSVTHIDVELEPSGIELQETEIVGRRISEKNETDIGLQNISIRELEALPQGVETDLFRSLQYVPGVRTTGDISAKYYVRGGASNQNLVLLNGAIIYNPFHALGMFSVIDPELINNVEFYKGGFTSEFGGRISSVMKVNSKDGNKNRYSAKASASMLTGKILLEGPLPGGSFMFTGRKVLSDEILKKFSNGKSLPVDFSDYTFKVNISEPLGIKGSKFTAHGFVSNDKLAHSNPLIEDYEWANNIWGVRWLQVGDSPLFFEMGISISNFKGEIIPNLSPTKPKMNEVNDLTIDGHYSYVYDSKDELSVGFEIKEISTDLYQENARGAITNVSIDGTGISVYAKYKFLRFEDFGLDLGLRSSLTRYVQRTKSYNPVEPRISFTYYVSPLIKIKGAWGMYQQELTTLANEDEVISIFEPWLILPNNMDPVEAIHYVLGTEITPMHNFTLEVEGYYKKVRNLPAINYNKNVFDDDDFIAGEGESYGLECLLKFSEGPFNLTAAYTRAYAYKNVEEWVSYPGYDSRNVINIGVNYDLTSTWHMNLTWVYNSGIPLTRINAFFDRYFIQDYYFNSSIYDDTESFVILGDQNLGRMPDYHRLDFTVSKDLSLNLVDLELSFSILNVYNRKNIFYFNRNTGERVNMLPFLPTASVKVKL